MYAEYEFIRDNLTDSRFEVTENIFDADILWLGSHFKDYENFSGIRVIMLFLILSREKLSALEYGKYWSLVNLQPIIDPDPDS